MFDRIRWAKWCLPNAPVKLVLMHVVNMLEHYYTILDFSESDLKQIPTNNSCIEKPQQWHKPTQRTSNVPILFKDILMIKHDYDADKRQKN